MFGCKVRRLALVNAADQLVDWTLELFEKDVDAQGTFAVQQIDGSIGGRLFRLAGGRRRRRVSNDRSHCRLQTEQLFDLLVTEADGRFFPYRRVYVLPYRVGCESK